MNRESAHRRIRELIQLLEINNNRLFLKDDPISTFDADYLRQLTRSLYEEIEKLQLAGGNVQNSPQDTRVNKNETDSGTVENTKVESLEERVQERVDGPNSEQIPEKKDPSREKPFLYVPTAESGIEPEKKPEVEPVVEPEIKPFVEPEIKPVIEPVEEPEVEPIKLPEEEPIKEPQEQPSTSKEENSVERSPEITAEPKVELPSESSNPAGWPPSIGKDIYARLRHSKIDSIKKAISISKRYELQNALFNKDPEAYNQAIRELDSASSMDHAFQLLDSFALKNKWDKENELFEELQTILLRRYM
ncbi:MAG: hypothetical protein H6606_11235 [Flavobacteriales bacterium]|nr:hypothetical protein [Flavobacteriales bacterium]